MKKKERCYACNKKVKQKDMYERYLKVDDDSKRVYLCHKCYHHIVYILNTYNDSY